ncbi:MAG: membrane protein insertase YidC [Gammaproteobacteria bacterium]
MENVRLMLVVALAFLGLMLWEAWQTDYAPRPQPSVEQPVSEAPAPAAGAETPPTPATNLPAVPATAPSPTAATGDITARTVDIETDLFAVTLSTAGATMQRAALRAYPVDPEAPDVPVELLGLDPPKVYVYQGGLAGDPALPTHHAVYSSDAESYRLADGADELVVPLTWRGDNGLVVEKRFRFRRGSYEVTVEYVVTNGSGEPLRVHHYEQLKRNEVSSRQGMVYTFTGAVLSTPEKRYEKFDLGDLEDAPIKVDASDAWIGVMQHYFVSALIPPPGTAVSFYSKVLEEERYLVGFLSPATSIAAGDSGTLTSTVYIGPKRHDIITEVAPGLELTVDYGILWFIAKPLFVVLDVLHDVTGNWGWAIIILPILLKLAFYPLSAAGYRSMANMRKVQPRMLALRERYKDDRQQLNQAMMQLYKDEKINPLGGCLPILIQIPVFIALYWVLLETVEMRQAPFILWITDLSTRDPLFVLPLLMGISMFVQQKLNPAPLDPMQAKVMQILPFVFTVFFAFFPSGLVLYWLVNNILSIAQQWHITRAIEQG